MVRIVYGDTLSCHFYYHVMHTYYLICILFCLYPPGEDGTNSGLKISVDDADMNTEKPPAVTPINDDDEDATVAWSAHEDGNDGMYICIYHVIIIL